jgi:alkylhydroperoxidase family enzyme
MARLPLVDSRHAAKPVREVLEALPVPLKIFGIMAHADTCFRPLLRLGSSILALQKLDPKLREFAVLQSAQLTPGRYEWVQHVPIAKSTGATDAQIEALERGDWEAECFDATERVLLRFGADTLQHARVSDELFASLRERFSPQEIVELVITLGYYSMLARLTEVTEPELDADADTKIVDAIPALEV